MPHVPSDSAKTRKPRLAAEPAASLHLGRAGGIELVWNGKYSAAGERIRPLQAPVELDVREWVGWPDEGSPPPSIQHTPAQANWLVHGDNLGVLRALQESFREQVDLIYLDPPFATGADFEFRAQLGGLRGSRQDAGLAYSDAWGPDLSGFLDAMAQRLELMRELLSSRGTLFLHCDWRTSHWMRCLLDEVFGRDAFKNEIVWRYRRWPARSRSFQRMHDVIFWYAKTPEGDHAWNPLYEPLAPSTLATWGSRQQVADFSSGRRKPRQSDTTSPGAPLSDVWNIGVIAPIARERLGYPTQKPEALLERIIASASREGDLVADFFAGSGTTLATAQKLGRRWLGCDASPVAMNVVRKRMLALSVEPTARPFGILESKRPAPEGTSECADGIAASPHRPLSEVAPSHRFRAWLEPLPPGRARVHFAALALPESHSAAEERVAGVEDPWALMDSVALTWGQGPSPFRTRWWAQRDEVSKLLPKSSGDFPWKEGQPVWALCTDLFGNLMQVEAKLAAQRAALESK